MKPMLLMVTCSLLFSISRFQNVGIGTLSPNANALLHVEPGSSTTKGLLLPGIYNPHLLFQVLAQAG
ncbi:MAG TPA: hypothetical protein VK498_08530 [Ferruginibacter sp.]|nr:hypothetical protein [Ferruginibacter sp.]